VFLKVQCRKIFFLYNISANFWKKSKRPLWYTQGLGGNWFMKRTRSKKSRDTVPLKTQNMFHGPTWRGRVWGRTCPPPCVPQCRPAALRQYAGPVRVALAPTRHGIWAKGKTHQCACANKCGSSPRSTSSSPSRYLSRVKTISCAKKHHAHARTNVGPVLWALASDHHGIWAKRKRINAHAQTNVGPVSVAPAAPAKNRIWAERRRFHA
jgi:hypothetical protein